MDSINCMMIHPGDYLLAASWELGSETIVKVSKVTENYVEDENKTKVSYVCLRGIPLACCELDKFDFLKNQLSVDSTLYQRDRLQIYIDNSKFENPPIVTVFGDNKGKQTSDFKYLHEAQHFFYRETGEKTKLKIKP